MSTAEYREPYFIWKDDNGKETIIADISWMFEDEGRMLLFNPANQSFSGLYERIMELLQLYVNKGKDNAYCGFIALGKVLEMAKSDSNINILYIGDNDLRFEFLINIQKMLSAYPVVAINRGFLRWVKNNQEVFFYGGWSENDKVNIKPFEDDFCDRDSYNLIIYDIEHKKINMERLLKCLKRNGGMLLFTRYKERMHNTGEEIFGDENIGYWKYSKAKYIEKDSLLFRIRQYRVDKLRALLENLKDELPYMKPESFEYMYFLRNSEKILNGYSNNVDALFLSRRTIIGEKLEKTVESISSYRKNKTSPCKSFEQLMYLENMIDSLLLEIRNAKVNVNVPFIGAEKHIETVVKNDLVKQGWWEHHLEDEKMHFYNWYPIANIKNDWLYKIVNNIPNRIKELNFYSVHGDDLRPRFMKKENKILYVQEDVCKRFMDYRDFCISSVDLIIADLVQSPNRNFDNKYVEFPYWIKTMFEPMMDIHNIRQRIEEINNAKSTCKYECALVASHDMYMNRTNLVKTLEDVLEIQCPGKFNHNSDLLKKEFGDNKRAYLRNFMFCACPENVNVKGWVTEKIFDAFASGAIPIYYGAHNEPIPEIINQDAVLFFDNGGDNLALKKRIMELKNNPDIYNKFISQKKLLKGTDEYVYERMHDLYEKLKEMST